MRSTWVWGLTMAAAAGAGAASVSADAGEGRALAERLCAACHAVSPAATESPHPKAPPLAVVAGRWPPEFLAEALAEGIVVAHDAAQPMPEFSLNPDEIEDLLDYLQRLRGLDR